MSNITGLSDNFGFEFMAVAMTKRSTEAQGKIAMSLLRTLLSLFSRSMHLHSQMAV